MKTGNLNHIILFLVTVAFLVLTSIAISKMKRKWQNVIFVIAVLICSGGIFFRYAMNFSFKEELHIDTLLIQMLQVCNFNFILLPLMLIPKCEIAKQYSIFFSMFAASTTLFSIPSSLALYQWNDVIVLNFWFNHVFAIALPIWMFAAKRLRPQRKYIPAVSACVFGYFTLVYLITEKLMDKGILPAGSSFSYVHDPGGMPLITQLYDLIGVPYWHLLPIFFIMIGFFYLWAMPFNKSVSFRTANGSGKLRRRYGTICNEITLPRTGFIRDGYELIGWSENPESQVAQYELGSKITIGKKNIVLYAVWKPSDQK